MEKTEIKVGGKKYPFYKTMRGVVLFSESGFTGEQMKQGNVRAILSFMYCYVRGACMRDGIGFDYDYESFIDAVDPDAMDDIAQFLQKSNTGETQESDQSKKN